MGKNYLIVSRLRRRQNESFWSTLVLILPLNCIIVLISWIINDTPVKMLDRSRVLLTIKKKDKLLNVKKDILYNEIRVYCNDRRA